MPTCAVKWCQITTARANQLGKQISFHQLPKDPEIRRKWLAFCRREDREDAPTVYLCSQHFAEDDFENRYMENRRRKLSRSAVPIDPEASKDESETDILNSDTTQELVVVQVDEIVEADISELRDLFCRICIQKKQNLIPLDSKLHNASLVDIIRIISGLDIIPCEELPYMICGECIEKIEMAHNVYLEFNNYARILKTMIKGKLLENHFKFYNQQEYINTLMESLNQEQEQIISTAESDVISEDPIEPSILLPFPSETATANEEGTLEKHDMAVIEGISSDGFDVNDLIEEEVEEIYLPIPSPTSPSTTEQKMETPTASNIEKLLRNLELIPNTCYICDDHTSYQDLKALNQHLEEHADKIPYTCNPCHTEKYPAVFRSTSGLNRHLLMHFYPHKCDYCWRRFPSLEPHTTHIKEMHESIDGFTCETCGARFKKRKLFLYHKNNHRVLSLEQFKCDECSKLFTSKALLTRHKRIHTGEKPFACRRCDKRFNHSYNLQVHVRRHIGESAYICKECGKSCFNTADLKAHMVKHFPERRRYREKKPKDYRCKIEGCDFETTKYHMLFAHRNQHLRPYTCEMCDKTFTTNGARKLHVQSEHEGVKPEPTMTCPYCPKMFICKTKLKEHVDMHENNRPHKCRFCEKTFVQKVNCIAHERIHTGERPFPCSVCSEKFITTSARKKHETKYHPKVDQVNEQLESV